MRPTLPHELLKTFSENDSLAVTFSGESISYRALNKRVNRLAAFLHSKGVREASMVAVYLPRGIDPLTTMYALWELGAVYIPFDPDRDSAHKAMAEAAEVTHCIIYPRATSEEAARHHSKLTDILDGLAVKPSIVEFSTAAAPPRDYAWVPAAPSFDRSAYVMFSSGITGKPKGMEFSFHGLAHWLNYFSKFHEGIELGSVLGFTSGEFDPSICEAIRALSAGSSLAIVSDEERTDISRLINFMKLHRVSDAILVPSVIKELLSDLPELHRYGMRRIVTTGEKCDQAMARACKAAGIELWNGYGPTEATFGFSEYKLEVEDFVNGMARIGKPEAPEQIFVVREESPGIFKKVTPGEQGIIVGAVGKNLTKRYLGDVSDEERARLLPEFFVDGVRHLGGFLTGDEAFVSEGGAIYFAGRVDNIIKVRGVLVNLEGIETKLSAMPDIKAVCVASNAGTVTACLEMAEGVAPPTLAELSRFLKAHAGLPPEAIPQEVMSFAALPRLAVSGKINRREIKDTLRLRVDSRYQAPRTRLEAQLLRAWDWLFTKAAIHKEGLVKKGLSPVAIQAEMLSLRNDWVFDAKLGELWDKLPEELKTTSLRLGIRHAFVAAGGDSLGAKALRKSLEELYKIPAGVIPDFGSLHELSVEKLSGVIYLILAAMYRSTKLSVPGLSGSALSTGLCCSPDFIAKAPLFLLPDITGSVPNSLVEALFRSDPTRPLYALSVLGLETDLATLSVEVMARDMIATIQQVQSTGPYNLAGYSLGAALAHAVARQFELMGERVGYLALIDGVQPSLVNQNKDYFAKELVRLLTRFNYPWKVGSLVLDRDFATNKERQEEVYNYLHQFGSEEQISCLSFVGEVSSEMRVMLEQLYLLADMNLDSLGQTQLKLFTSSDTCQRVGACGGFSDAKQNRLRATLGWKQLGKAKPNISAYPLEGADHFSILGSHFLEELVEEMEADLVWSNNHRAPEAPQHNEALLVKMDEMSSVIGGDLRELLDGMAAMKRRMDNLIAGAIIAATPSADAGRVRAAARAEWTKQAATPMGAARAVAPGAGVMTALGKVVATPSSQVRMAADDGARGMRSPRAAAALPALAYPPGDGDWYHATSSAEADEEAFSRPGMKGSGAALPRASSTGSSSGLFGLQKASFITAGVTPAATVVVGRTSSAGDPASVSKGVQGGFGSY